MIIIPIAYSTGRREELPIQFLKNMVYILLIFSEAVQLRGAIFQSAFLSILSPL